MLSWKQRCAVLAAVSVVPIALFHSPARAGQASAEAPATRRVQWDASWHRFRWWEYGATPVLGAVSVYLHYYAPLPAQAKWQGDNFVDGALRDWLLADSPAGRAKAGEIGDALWLGGTAMPFVIDVPVLLFAHRQPAVAWQVLMMDLEANAVAGFINNALFYEIGRGRPSYASCAADPSYDPLCGATGNNASFPSGHVLGIATAAGLTCVHHRYLPIYGNASADAGVCIFMSVATLATGITRITADRHYASDVAAGAVIGFGVGYGLPWLLHYRTGADAHGPEAGHVFVLPFAGAHSFGLAFNGFL